jgi:hypothetical protein
VSGPTVVIPPRSTIVEPPVPPRPPAPAAPIVPAAPAAPIVPAAPLTVPPAVPGVPDAPATALAPPRPPATPPPATPVPAAPPPAPPVDPPAPPGPPLAPALPPLPAWAPPPLPAGPPPTPLSVASRFALPHAANKTTAPITSALAPNIKPLVPRRGCRSTETGCQPCSRAADERHQVASVEFGAELKGGTGTTWITDFSVDLTTSAPTP